MRLLSGEDRVGETQPGSAGALPSHSALSASTFAAGERELRWLGFSQLKRWAGGEADDEARCFLSQLLLPGGSWFDPCGITLLGGTM